MPRRTRSKCKSIRSKCKNIRNKSNSTKSKGATIKKRNKNKKGGMFPASKKQKLQEPNAQDILVTIPIYPDPTKGKFVLNRKSFEDLIMWIKTADLERNIEKDIYKSNTISGTGTLSQKYIDKYRPIATIWGYTSDPYINYELLTHNDYNGQPLRSFQDISDPLMRNLQRLSEGQELLPYDTTVFLRKMYSTIDKLKQDEDDGSGKDYVNWFCSTVLPHFLKQANISTLLYELADQKWLYTEDKNDINVLLFLSLVARLFLLFAVKEWDKMRELLDYVGIY